MAEATRTITVSVVTLSRSAASIAAAVENVLWTSAGIIDLCRSSGAKASISAAKASKKAYRNDIRPAMDAGARLGTASSGAIPATAERFLSIALVPRMAWLAAATDAPS